MSLMNTRNPYHLGVSLASVGGFYPTLRVWRYGTEFGGGFRFLEADPTKPEDELETQSDYSFNELADHLLGLVEPIRLLTAQELERKGFVEGFGIKEDLEPSEVVEFLNRFGQIGLADYLRLAKLQRKFTIDKGELTPEQALALLEIPYDYLAIVQKSYKEEPKKWRSMIRKIQDGDLIPFGWIQKDLFDLARCIRILLALHRNYIDSKTFFSLPATRSKELRRFLLASEAVMLPRGEDENYLPLGGKKGDPWGVSEQKIKSKWQEFAVNLNRFLTPITYNAIIARLEGGLTFQKTLGIETWLIYEMLNSRASIIERKCARKSCRRPFVGYRSTARYCSDTCSAVERNRKKRERDRSKDSSGRGQKKKQTKGRANAKKKTVG